MQITMVLEYHEITTAFFSDFRATVIVMFKCLYGLGETKVGRYLQIEFHVIAYFRLFVSLTLNSYLRGGDEGLDLGHFFVNCHSEFMAK